MELLSPWAPAMHTERQPPPCDMVNHVAWQPTAMRQDQGHGAWHRTPQGQGQAGAKHTIAADQVQDILQPIQIVDIHIYIYIFFYTAIAKEGVQKEWKL